MLNSIDEDDAIRRYVHPQSPGRCRRCGGRFNDIAWISYEEYPGAGRTSKEPVSPCCHAGYEED